MIFDVGQEKKTYILNNEKATWKKDIELCKGHPA